MPIRGPKNAIPTLKGWVHPKTSELLKSQKITQSQIDEWFGIIVEPEPQTVEIIDNEVADFNEDGTIDEFESMTKTQLEEYGRVVGIELDRRKKKSDLIEELKAFLNN